MEYLKKVKGATKINEVKSWFLKKGYTSVKDIFLRTYLEDLKEWENEKELSIQIPIDELWDFSSCKITIIGAIHIIWNNEKDCVSDSQLSINRVILEYSTSNTLEKDFYIDYDSSIINNENKSQIWQQLETLLLSKFCLKK